MKHLDILGTKLKDDFLCDLFETYDVQVIYSYDRLHENLGDEYQAEIPDLGLEFAFDEFQVLKTIFMKPVEVTTFNPIENDDKIRFFSSIEEARGYAQTHGIGASEGSGDFMGTHRNWICFDAGEYSIHYEFIGSELHMITLQCVKS